MRLIDADALHYGLTVETVKCARMSEETKWTMAERVLNRLDEAPTLDPAQLVPTAYWFCTDYDYFTCSNCGESYLTGAECTSEAKEMLASGDFHKFCHECGRRMVKKEEYYEST